MRYTFSEEEKIFLKKQAQERGSSKRKSRIRSKKYDQNKSDYAVDIVGTLSEYATAQLLKGNYNSEIYARHGDDGINDITIEGVTKSVQIKATTHPLSDNGPYCFYTELDPDKIADYTIMCLGSDDINSIDVYGYITKEDFMKKHVVKNFGYGLRYAVPVQMLTPIETLIKLIADSKLVGETTS